MKKILHTLFWVIFITMSIITIAWGGATLQEQTETKQWNNGICKCEGHYQLFDVEKDKSGEFYYYKCDKCNNIFRSNHCFKYEN